MIYAVSMFRNEADITEPVIRHLFAEGVDRIIVADNLSTDGTPRILARLADEYPLEIIRDEETAYYQSQKMTFLARMAWGQGASWVLPFDADELWYAPDHDSIADALAACTHDVCVCYGWDHIATRNMPAGNPIERIRFRRPDPQPLPKVVFRADPGVEIRQGNHSVAHPGIGGLGPLAFRHFQYRTYVQYQAKVRHGKLAYELTDLAESEGAHWREAGGLPEKELIARWDELCATPGLVEDPAPLRR